LSTVGADNSEKVYFMIAARDEKKTLSKKSHFKVTGFFFVYHNWSCDFN